jgi:RNA polymerase sigma factor (sigma-70 family)
MPSCVVKQFTPSETNSETPRLPLKSSTSAQRMMVLHNLSDKRPDTFEKVEMLKRQDSTIHVIDEDGWVRQTVSGMLWSSGYCVQSYAGITQFLSRELSASAACLILDLSGPSLEGVLSRKPRYIPAIVFGGSSDVKTAVRAMKSGAVDFLVKPIDEEELLSAVESALTASEQNLARWQGLERDQAIFVRLSPREQEICLRIVQGLLNKEIAFEFGISEKTVKAQRSNVMKKLEADSLPDVVKLVERLRTADAIPTVSDHPPFRRTCTISRTHWLSP